MPNGHLPPRKVLKAISRAQPASSSHTQHRTVARSAASTSGTAAAGSAPHCLLVALAWVDVECGRPQAIDAVDFELAHAIDALDEIGERRNRLIAERPARDLHIRAPGGEADRRRTEVVAAATAADGSAVERRNVVVATLVRAAARLADRGDLQGVGLGDRDRRFLRRTLGRRGRVRTGGPVLARDAEVPALLDILLLGDQELRRRSADRLLALVERRA